MNKFALTNAAIIAEQFDAIVNAFDSLGGSLDANHLNIYCGLSVDEAISRGWIVAADVSCYKVLGRLHFLPAGDVATELEAQRRAPTLADATRLLDAGLADLQREHDELLAKLKALENRTGDGDVEQPPHCDVPVPMMRAAADNYESQANGGPAITMREFFDLPEVRELQAIQKRNRYGSQPHRDAYQKICSLAKVFGAEQYCKPEDY